MKPRLNTPKKNIWHHANGMIGNPCAPTQRHTADIVDSSHTDRWPGFTSRVYKNSVGEFFHVGYHLVIDINDETIIRTRAFSEEGAHCIGMNRSSIGILIIGNYDACSGEKIPKEKEWLIATAWDMIKGEYPLLTVQDNVPHRKYASKSCYGNSLDDVYVQNVIMRSKTVQDQPEKQEELLRINSMQQDIIDAYRQIVALLVQRLSGKRLSLKEVRNPA